MWKLRIEQYFQVQDYALWDVIENGNSFKPVPRITANADGTSTLTISGPVTAEEQAQKKNDVKSRSILLMTLLNEHLLTFSQYKNAKIFFEAIQGRFDGNDATKKTQKTLLKQMYENFNPPSIESLDSIFNRLQKIVSQLDILSENISQEDLNMRFLRSLAAEWNTHVVVWRNKPDIKTMSFDDLYNNFKIVEQEVKRTVVSSSISGSPNMDFLSSPSNTNEVDTASIQVSAASTPVSTDDLEEIDLKRQLALLSMRARRYLQRTGKKITINGSDTAGYDKIKVECFNYHKMGHFARECKSPRSQESKPRNQDSSRKTMIVEETSSKAMVTIDGSGYDWSYIGDDQVPTNMALMPFSDSEKVFDAPIIEDWVFNYDEDDSEEVVLKSKKVQHKPEQVNQPRKENQNPRNNRKNKNQMKIQKLGVGFQFSNKACCMCGSFSHLIKDYDFHDKKTVLKPVSKTMEKKYGQREVRPVWNHAMRVNHQNFSNYRRNFAPITVLTKSGVVPISIARQSSSRVAAPVSTVRLIITVTPKPIVNDAKSRQNAFQKTHSLSRRPFHKQTSLQNRYLVNTAKVKSINTVYTCKGKSVTSAVRKQGSNVVKSSACWVWRPKIKIQDHVSKNSGSYICKRFNYGNPQVALRDTVIFDSGCSRHITKNKSFLLDYQEYDRGFVAFAGSSKGVTILNTLDHLEKFDGKADEGFLVGYSVNSKDFRVYNSKTKKVEKNLHVNFLENKLNVVGSGLEWLLDIDSLTNLMNYQPDSVGNRTNVLNTSSDVPLSNEEVVSSPKDDVGKNTNSINTASATVNTASDKDGTFQRTYGEWNFSTPILVNDVGSSFSHPAALDDFSKISNLEDTGIFNDAYDDINEGVKPDYNNLETVEPKKVTQALDDESWVEAMQEELLQFKLLNVWTLVDLPHGKIAIGTKWTMIHVNESAICVVKNPVYHSKTKHIEIRHHFIRDSYEKRLIEMVKIHIDSNVADLLTKAFDVTRFQLLVASIGIGLKGYFLNDGYADLVQHAGG
nr:hypothetical protein [Tanacetum cinerariifolium]